MESGRKVIRFSSKYKSDKRLQYPISDGREHNLFLLASSKTNDFKLRIDFEKNSSKLKF